MFENFRYVPYRFGNSKTFTFVQDLTVYVDLVDQLKDNVSFYRKYTILDGDRPDNLSQKLYGTPHYAWMFFLMNDSLREQGWPLSNQVLLAQVKKRYPFSVLTTLDDVALTMNVGSEVIGVESGAVGTIVSKNLDLGQVVVDTAGSFLSDEDVQATEDDVVNSVTLYSATEQYLSVDHYEDETGMHVDIDPHTGPGALLLPVTVHDVFVRQNDSLKDIRIVKPEVADGVYEMFQRAVAEG